MHDRKHNLNESEARHRGEDHVTEPHDRRHGAAGGPDADDHDGERKLSLSAKSLAARGDALDGSEDGVVEEDADPEA